MRELLVFAECCLFYKAAQEILKSIDLTKETPPGFSEKVMLLVLSLYISFRLFPLLTRTFFGFPEKNHDDDELIMRM